MDFLQCWDSVYTADICCDLKVSPRGLNKCWSGEFTFEACCTPQEFGGNVARDSAQTLPAEIQTSTITILSRMVGATSRQVNSLDCWDGSFDARRCCDLRISSRGRTECWSGGFTFEACCRIQPSRHVEAHYINAFRSCSTCVELASRPYFNREAWKLCADKQLSVWSYGNARSGKALCVPDNQTYSPVDDFPRLLRVIEREAYVPRISLEDCTPPWTWENYGTVIFMLIPFAVGVVQMVGFPCCSSLAQSRRTEAQTQSNTAKIPNNEEKYDSVFHSRCSRQSSGPIHVDRIVALDFVRVAATICTVVLHFNFTSFNTFYSLNLEHLLRSVDAFTVAAVVSLVRSRPTGVLDSMDYVFRKLSRQLPIYAFPRYLLGSKFCPRTTSCLTENSWNETHTLRALAFFRLQMSTAHSWALRIDLKITLFFLSLLIVKHYCGPAALRYALVLITAICVNAVYVHLHTGTRLYPHFWAYRLPLAIASFVVVGSSYIGCPRFIGFALHDSCSRVRWVRRLLVVVGLSFGWVMCAKPVTRAHRPTCLDRDAYFLLGGLIFTCSLTAVCSCPKLFPVWPRPPFSLVALSFPMLQLHDFIRVTSLRCQQSGGNLWFSTWTYARGHSLYTDEQLNESSAYNRIISISTIPVSLLLSQMAIWVVQGPWARTLCQLPDGVRRCVTCLYIAYFLYDCYLSGELSPTSSTT